MNPPANSFDRLAWESDTRVRVGDVEFDMQLGGGPSSDERSSFTLVKDRPILEAYRRYWSTHAPPEVSNLFEVGLWDGASVAFWHELLEPDVHVGVDIEDRSTKLFRAYAAAERRRERIATYWDVDQADQARLRELATAHFDGPLDLVIDDASHLYGPTKATLEALLPLVRPGGWYVIEDWAWGHWGAEYMLDPSPDTTALTRLVDELVAVTGSWQEIVTAVDVRRQFIVIHRGEAVLDDGPFELDDAWFWGGAGFSSMGEADSSPAPNGPKRRDRRGLKALLRTPRGRG